MEYMHSTYSDKNYIQGHQSMEYMHSTYSDKKYIYKDHYTRGVKHALPRRLDEGQLSDPGKTYTVEPPNKGHFGSGAFVLFSEFVLWWKVRVNLLLFAHQDLLYLDSMF